MNKLPDSISNHPFFRTYKAEMSEKVLHYKNKIDNYSNLDKKEKFNIFEQMLNLHVFWPDPLRQEGFWCEKEEKNNLFKEYPYPKENQMKKEDLADFLNKLDKVEKKSPTFRYMGYSTCRICEQRNGTQTYYTDLFAWPEGYKHYIKDHGVQPSAAFVLHIRGLIT